MSQSEFYERLASELIENEYDRVGTRSAHLHAQSPIPGKVFLRSGTREHLTPSKKKRKAHGRISNAVEQGRCKVCHVKKSKYLCSACVDASKDNIFICHTETGRDCFTKHLHDCHNVTP